jgi:hypothetical protein
MSAMLFAVVDGVLECERGRAWHARRRGDLLGWWRSAWGER